jgi:multicomponent Na+:H+ antiporter subunit B
VNPRVRVGLFLVAAAGAAALFAWGGAGLQPFGHYPGPYGDEVVRVFGTARHATNAITSVVMDIRAVDTAAEELILYAAAVGTLMLLRRMEGEQVGPPHEQAPERPVVDPSVPIRVVSAVLIAPAALLGLYLVAHGQLTPGGGFQGGVVLAAPSMFVFLAARLRSFERLHRQVRWEITQAVAVSGFIGIGFVGLVVGGAFLTNVIALGQTGTVFSSGTIEVLNAVAGPAVATAIVLIAVALLEQVTEVQAK